MYPSLMMNEGGALALSLCVLTLTIVWAARRLKSSRRLVEVIPGPKSTSWIYGNMPQLLLSDQYGEHEFQWQEMYGQVYSIKGCFGQTRLIISDPLTIKYILNNDVFVCGPSLEKATNAVWGRDNILVLRGHPHRHLRNIMNPSFSSNKIRELLPVIRETGRKLASRWESLGFVGSTVDIARTLNDAALDLMGDAILGNPFNALVGQSELAGIQRAMTDAVSSPTELGQIFDAALPYIPDLLLRGISHLPIPGTQMFRKYMKLTDELALQLAGQQRDEGLEVGQQSLIGSFVTSDVPTRDIGTHLRSILVAGADTSGGTMGWILYKLAQMPDFQQDVREEIRLSKLEDQGDYDNMPLLNAIINEVLRMYSVFPLAERVASEDCLLPLIEPITTVTGAQISEIQIKKGQCLYVAISAYHRYEMTVAAWLNAPDSGYAPSGDPMLASSGHLGGLKRNPAKGQLSDPTPPF